MKLAAYLILGAYFLVACIDPRQSGDSESGLLDHTHISNKEAMTTIELPKNRYEGDDFGSKTFRDVMDHAVPFGGSVWRHLETDEPAINAHETLHAFPRNYKKSGKYFTLYLGGGLGLPLEPSTITKQQVANNIPKSIIELTSTRFGSQSPIGIANISYTTYFQQPSNVPSKALANHILWEWVCYIFDATISSELDATLRSDVKNNSTFLYFSAAYLLTAAKLNPKLLSDHSAEAPYRQLKAAFKALAELSMKSHNKLIEQNHPNAPFNRHLINHLLTSDEAAAIRNNIISLYGEDWFTQVFHDGGDQ